MQEADGRHFEVTRKIAMSQQRFDRPARNLALWRILTHRTVSAVKIS